jgi:peroxin-12
VDDDLQSDASVSEHFYQLHLVQAGGIPTPRLNTIETPRHGRLSRKQQWGLLMFLIGLPYIRTKAQQYFETLRNEDSASSSETTVSL